MNTLLVLILTAFTPAHASSMDIHCSNADASVRSGGGHRPSFLQITERDWNTGEDRLIRDEEGALVLNVIGGQQLKQEKNTSRCRDGIQGLWFRTTYTEEAVITKADGSLFSRNTLNVSPDLKSVKTLLICERVVTNIAPCPR